MPDFADALSEDSQGVIIAIEVTAGSRSDVFPYGYNEWRKCIGCRVSAAAQEGRANRAIVALISDVLDVPTSAVSIITGSTSSLKRVHIAGTGKNELLKRLKELL